MVDNGLVIEERDDNLEIQGYYVYLDENNFITGYSSSRDDNLPFVPTESFPNQDPDTNLLLYRWVNEELIFDDSRIKQIRIDKEQIEEEERLTELEKDQAIDKMKDTIRDLELALEQKDMDIFNIQIALADVYELLMGGL